MLRLAALLALLAGCPFTAPTPQSRVRKGPAAAAVVSPLAPLPIVCTDVGQNCNEAQMAAVRVQTRMDLEFAGYLVIDGETINTEMQKRTLVTHDHETDRTPVVTPVDPYNPQPPTPDNVTETVEGRTWSDLSPEDQRAVLVSMGAQGVLITRVTFGMPHGMARQQTVTVAITIYRANDNALAWASKCSVETGDYNKSDRALETATRCALESATLW